MGAGARLMESPIRRTGPEPTQLTAHITSGESSATAAPPRCLLCGHRGGTMLRCRVGRADDGEGDVGDDPHARARAHAAERAAAHAGERHVHEVCARFLSGVFIEQGEDGALEALVDAATLEVATRSREKTKQSEASRSWKHAPSIQSRSPIRLAHSSMPSSLRESSSLPTAPVP